MKNMSKFIQNKINTDPLKLDLQIKQLKFKDYCQNYNYYMRVISLEEFKRIF